MRSDLRLRLREITESLSTAKTGVAGVTGVPIPAVYPVLHPTGTPLVPEKDQRNQRVTPGTPCYTLKNGSDEKRYTSEGVTAGVAGAAAGVAADAEDWFAHFEERAAIREYEGGFASAEAERLALDETVAALGPRPGILH